MNSDIIKNSICDLINQESIDGFSIYLFIKKMKFREVDNTTLNTIRLNLNLVSSIRGNTLYYYKEILNIKDWNYIILYFIIQKLYTNNLTYKTYNKKLFIQALIKIIKNINVKQLICIKNKLSNNKLSAKTMLYISFGSNLKYFLNYKSEHYYISLSDYNNCITKDYILLINTQEDLLQLLKIKTTKNQYIPFTIISNIDYKFLQNNIEINFYNISLFKTFYTTANIDFVKYYLKKLCANIDSCLLFNEIFQYIKDNKEIIKYYISLLSAEQLHYIYEGILHYDEHNVYIVFKNMSNEQKGQVISLMNFENKVRYTNMFL